jgi:hypothetical protein
MTVRLFYFFNSAATYAGDEPCPKRSTLAVGVRDRCFMRTAIDILGVGELPLRVSEVRHD